MPGYTTHLLFGRKTYQNIPECRIKEAIRAYPESYKLGLQGPDIFFFYIPCLLGDGSKNLGSLMHSRKINRFFHKYISVTEHLSQDNKDIALSFLSGFLCHYHLDTTCHPYIYARTKYKPDENFNSLLYYADHRTFETSIDTAMLFYTKHKKPSAYSREKLLNLSKKEKQLISFVLSYSINKTFYKESEPTCQKYKFHKDSVSKQPKLDTERRPASLVLNNKEKRKENKSYLEQLYYRNRFHVNPGLKLLLPFEDVISPEFIRRAVKSVNIGCRCLTDKTGKRRKKVKDMETITVQYDLLSSLIPFDEFIDGEDCLNKNKEIWYSPWDKTHPRSESFLELYHNAVRTCIRNVKLLNEYMICKSIQPVDKGTKKLREQLLNFIGDNSYHSGLQWDLTLERK